jgi:hypothetical protein
LLLLLYNSKQEYPFFFRDMVAFLVGIKMYSRQMFKEGTKQQTVQSVTQYVAVPRRSLLSQYVAVPRRSLLSQYVAVPRRFLLSQYVAVPRRSFLS